MKPQHVQFWPWNDPWHGNFDLTDDGDRSCELDDWPMNRSCPNKIFFHIRTACMTIKAIFCSNCSLFTEMLEHFFLQNTKIYIKIWCRFQTGCFVSSVFPTNAKGQPRKTTHGTSNPNHPFPNQLKAYRQRRKCGAFGLRRSEAGCLMAKDLLVNHDE